MRRTARGARLEHGDEIHLGSAVLRFQLDGPAPRIRRLVRYRRSDTAPGFFGHNLTVRFWENPARYNARMYTPQAGIFALGTSSHAYLEFDILDAKKCKEFASTISAIREPRTTTGGVNFVIGFRPELWRDIVPEDAPAGRGGL